MGEQLALAAAPPPRAGAVISDCGRYRYRLWRGAEPGRPAIFVMCNPSTANASKDDATIRKCRGFARRWGCTGIEVVNVCAFRSRHPKDLLSVSDPVGPDNKRYIEQALIECTRHGEPLVVVAWGDALPRELRWHAQTTLGWFEELSIEPRCLGTTKSGAPKHPLMPAYATPLEVFGG